MSQKGNFEIDEADVVRLYPSASAEVAASDGDDLPAAITPRSGWVNTSVFAVRLDVDLAGKLVVEVYPLGTEMSCIGQIAVSRQASVDNDGVDLDA